MKVGDLVRIKKQERHLHTKLTPWAQKAYDQGTAMLVIPDPSHWEEAPMPNDKYVCCVLFENKLRVVTCADLEIVSG
jgi:hypothetical protein